MGEPEQYSIEWFREMNADNPKWLGTQAFKLWEHYVALEAKLEAMERAGRGLLHVLPDSLFHARIEDDDSWEWCWNELSGHAQDHVKAAREAWPPPNRRRKNE